MSKCIRCGNEINESKLCPQCQYDYIIKNELIGKIKAKVYQIKDTIDSDTGKIYICRRDMFDILNDCREMFKG